MLGFHQARERIASNSNRVSTQTSTLVMKSKDLANGCFLDVAIILQPSSSPQLRALKNTNTPIVLLSQAQVKLKWG